MSEQPKAVAPAEPKEGEKKDGVAKKKFRNKKGNKPMDKPQQNPPPSAKLVEPELPKPTHKQENKSRQANVKLTNESHQAESFFEPDSDFHAAVREIDFQPLLTGWTDVSDQTYTELKNDRGIQVSKEMPIEALRYYNASLFWLRSISLKLWLGRELTLAEQNVQRTFEGKSLTILEPQYVGLKALGKTTTRNGEVLAPVLPELPTTVTAQTPGGLGVIDTVNHSLYEDLPLMGPAFQGCFQRAQTIDQAVYASAFAPAGTTANRNLQGFAPLSAIRRDPIDLLNTMGFNQGERPPTISGSGINYNAVKTVSNLLSRVTSFKTVDVDVFSIPATGSISQIIEQVPSIDTIDHFNRASSLDITSQAYSNESKSHIGISSVYGLCQYKSLGENNSPTSWSAITYTDAVPIPPASIANRNDRRNLPTRFGDRVFYTSIDNEGDLRKTVISRMAHHKS